MSDGAELLNDVEAFLRRFVAFPSDAAAVASVLWAAHAHLLACFDSTPRLAYLSPEPGSGKTRALEILETLVPNPMLAVNATPAALFRAVADAEHPPTVLFDEIDTIFGPKAKDNEELRGLINAGHRRSGVSYRCVGDGSSQTVVAFPSYAAIALAGLGDLPDTILTRSVVIRMRRRAPHEKVAPYRQRRNEPEGHALRTRLATWSTTVAQTLTEAEPAMPEGVEDRPADVWEPLLGIADAAGGTWPHRGRHACVELIHAAADPAKVSLGIRLLADLRTVFAGDDKLSTAAIVDRLCALDDAPWGDLYGKPIDPRGLARRLKDYTTAEGDPIKARTVRCPDGTTAKGYHAADLADAWTRYLPAIEDDPTAPDGNAPMASQEACDAPLSVTRHTSDTQNPALTWGVSAVTDVTDLSQAGTGPVPVPVESGRCWHCGHDFRRYAPTDHPEYCTTCATTSKAS